MLFPLIFTSKNYSDASILEEFPLLSPINVSLRHWLSRLPISHVAVTFNLAREELLQDTTVKILAYDFVWKLYLIVS